MEQRTIVLVALAGLALAGGAGLMLADGFGLAPGGPSGDGSNVSEFPTATATPTSAGGGGEATDSGAGGTTATPEPAPAFAFEVRQIESCGQTCRDVTSSVSNTGDAAATDVVVYSRIFVGNSTSEDDLAWQGKEQVGTLPAGETYTATNRVELSYGEALAIQQNGGWITVQTTVQSDEKTVTFTERYDVA
jgi:hypothetical protein